MSAVLTFESQNSLFRKNFFDQIDEFIPYPPDFSRQKMNNAMGIANDKILFYDWTLWRPDVERINEYSYSFNRRKWKNSSVETTDEIKEIDFNSYLHVLRVENFQKER